MEKFWYIYSAGFVGGFITNCILLTVYRTMNKFQNETIRPIEETPYCIYCNR